MVKVKSFSNFWKNKRVLVTGHTGFKGAWLCLILNIFGAKIIGYSLKPKKKSLFNDIKLKNKIYKSYYRDINDFYNVDKVIKNERPEIIIHMAAQAIVSESFFDPYNTFKTNILGTLNVLESIKTKKNIKSVLFITTDKVYKINSTAKKYSEMDILDGNDPYSSSKVSQELLVKSYYNSFFYKRFLQGRVSTARSGNVIGGGDYSKDRLIPDMLKSYNKKNVLTLRNPNYVRPWQHVLEPLIGYLILAEKQYKNKLNKNYNSWNFGPNDASFISVKSIINISYKYFRNLKIKLNLKNNRQFKETTILKLDSSKAKKFLKWKPKWNIEYTIMKIFEWNQLNKIKNNSYNACKKQILDYLN